MKQFLSFLLVCILCTPARSELLGNVVGRGANLQYQSTLSFEAGFSWYTRQLQWSSARINFKPLPGLLTYFDVAKLRAKRLPVDGRRESDFSGTGFGCGLVFVLPKLASRYDIAIKFSYHSGAIDSTKSLVPNSNLLGLTAPQFTLQQSQWSGEFILSHIDPLFENGLAGYLTLGYVSTDARLKQPASGQDQSAEFIDYRPVDGLAIGVGLNGPLGRGQWFAGIKSVASDPLLGLGFRYSIK